MAALGGTAAAYSTAGQGKAFGLPVMVLLEAEIEEINVAVRPLTQFTKTSIGRSGVELSSKAGPLLRSLRRNLRHAQLLQFNSGGRFRPNRVSCSTAPRVCGLGIWSKQISRGLIEVCYGFAKFAVRVNFKLGNNRWPVGRDVPRVDPLGGTLPRPACRLDEAKK
jgi:hypothetical protein